MPSAHKNKTIATFLAFLAGALGIHRFYLYGWKDVWGWVHLSSLPLSIAALFLVSGQPLMFIAAPLIVSALTAVLEALVIGLTPDDKWDARHNPASGRTSRSGWPIAILLVLITGVGATALIAVIARTFDLLFTGGSYG